MSADYRRQCCKIHLGTDAATLEIRAIEVTDNATGAAPVLACVLEQISVDETIASVSGDGAYGTKGFHEAIAQRGAQAIIPTRRKAKLWKDKRSGAEARNAIFMPHVGLAAGFGKNGLGTTGVVWLKPR